jgi:hypothetical protein
MIANVTKAPSARAAEQGASIVFGEVRQTPIAAKDAGRLRLMIERPHPSQADA